MNSKRFFFVMLGVVIVLGGLIIGAVYLGNGLLVKQSNKLVGLKLDSQVADQQQASLSQAKKDIAAYSDLASAAKTIVPQDKDQAKTVREIVKIAADNNIKLSAINFPASNLGQAATPKPAGTTSTSNASTPQKSTVTQVQPVTGINGVYAMPVTIQSDANTRIPYVNFIGFLQALENNRRTAQVSTIDITPDKQNNSTLNFTLTLNIYIKP